MKFRRSFLLASLAALTLGAASVHAQDNVLRVGTDATFPPMEFVENDKRTGFDIELVEAVAKTIGNQRPLGGVSRGGLVAGGKTRTRAL